MAVGEKAIGHWRLQPGPLRRIVCVWGDGTHRGWNWDQGFGMKAAALLLAVALFDYLGKKN